MPHPPTFGASLRDRWLLDPAVTYLNHGTVGAPPRAVLAHQRAIQDEIERQPARFLLHELDDAHATGTERTPRLRKAANAVANFLAAIRGEAKPNAEIAEGVASTLLCHLGNIAHRVGRSLQCDPKDGKILNDPEAMRFWSKEYAPGWEAKLS